MPSKRDDTHQLIERELVVFRRPNTQVWYCRYKIEDTWFTSTTKERDLAKASASAQKIHARAQLRREDNQPVVTKRFRDVAQLVLKAMEARIALGHKVDSYQQYKRIIDKYLVPFLGSMVISNITSEVIKDYEKWRSEQMGKTPKYSTVRKHNVVLNLIFKEAISRNLMSGLKMPYLETKGQKSERYPTFTVLETNIILANMPEWVSNARDNHKEQRQLLYDYVRVLVDTGARPGKELLDLQWKNIDFEVQHETSNVQHVEDQIEKAYRLDYEREYVELSNGPYDSEGNPLSDTTWIPIVTLFVDGKEGAREAVGYDMTYRVLKEIAERRYKKIQQSRKLQHLVENKNDDKIFVTSNGKGLPSAIHMFQNFLQEYNLLEERNTGRKRVLYSFRSLFSTAVMDYDDVDMRDLAKALGNSPEMLMKRYDRGTLKQIKHKLKAPNARQALFKPVEVPDLYQSSKAAAKAIKLKSKNKNDD